MCFSCAFILFVSLKETCFFFVVVETVMALHSFWTEQAALVQRGPTGARVNPLGNNLKVTHTNNFVWSA